MATPIEEQPPRPVLSADDRQRIVEEERVRFEARRALENQSLEDAATSVLSFPPASSPEEARSRAIGIAIGVPALFIAGIVYFSFQHQQASRRAAEAASRASAAVEACRKELTRRTGPPEPLTLSYEPKAATGASVQVLIRVDAGKAGKATIDCTARQASDGTWGASLGPVTY